MPLESDVKKNDTTNCFINIVFFSIKFEVKGFESHFAVKNSKITAMYLNLDHIECRFFFSADSTYNNIVKDDNFH